MLCAEMSLQKRRRTRDVLGFHTELKLRGPFSEPESQDEQRVSGQAMAAL